jgi:hypothetical protein
MNAAEAIRDLEQEPEETMSALVRARKVGRS